jgi:hypothetical protein
MDQVKGCIWSMWRRTSSPGASQKVACGQARSTHTRRGNGVAIKDNLGAIIESSTAMVASFCANNAAWGRFRRPRIPTGRRTVPSNTVADRPLAANFQAGTM